MIYVDGKPAVFKSEGGKIFLMGCTHPYRAFICDEPARLTFHDDLDGKVEAAISLPHHEGRDGAWSYVGIRMADAVFNPRAALIKLVDAGFMINVSRVNEFYEYLFERYSELGFDHVWYPADEGDGGAEAVGAVPYARRGLVMQPGEYH